MSFVLIVNLQLHFINYSEREVRERQELEEAGLTAAERMCLYDDDIVMTSSKKRHKYESTESEDNICDVSKKICYISMVSKTGGYEF